MSSIWFRRRVSVGIGTAVCAVTLLHDVNTMADGFRNPPEGAASLGMAGVSMTEGKDPSAVTHNPANLMDLKEVQVMPSVDIGYSKRKYTSPSGQTEESKNPWTYLPAIYASMPIQGGNSALGVGVSVPYGQAVEWDQNGIFKYRAPYYAEMRSFNINPTFATRLGSAVTVGVGADLMYSDLEFRQLMPWLPLPGGYYGPTSRLIFEGDGMAFGGNAGLTWQVTENQRLAVTYRSPMSVQYEGSFTMENPPPAGTLPPGMTPRSDFETEIDFPSVAALGYGIRITQTVRAEAMVEWVEHSRNESLDLDIANNNPLLIAMGSTSIPQKWKDTWTYGLGVEWDCTKLVTLRSGWYHLPSPVPEETLSPTLAEADKDAIAVGVGIHSGQNALDLAYCYNICDDQTVDSALNPIQGKYEFETHLFAVTYVRKF
jgi:long-chain fatty acid transport protein